MRLVTYRSDVSDAARLGALVDDLVIDLQRLGAANGVSLPASMLDFIDLGKPAIKPTAALLKDNESNWPVGTALPIENVTLLAPIPRPRKNIFGIGLNYVEHVEESSRSLDTSAKLPDKPIIFAKTPNSVIGPDEAIEHNADITQQLDWEVELAAILGTRASRIKEEDALSHVFGYSLMVDVSARDCRRAGQWIYSKGLDTYAPFGPCIITADEVPDPQTLDLWLTVNGETKQSSNTKHMLFNVAHLITDISAGMTMDPGDIIATGTPSGVGAGRNPQEWLWPGDVIESHVQGIGTLRNPVVPV